MNDNATPVRVLLADDHRMLREGLRRTLEDNGLVVVGEADDGAEAVRLALDTEPDVVVMDVTMPNVDGVEATRQLRAQRPDARIVMLTMHSDQDIVANAIRAGASGYLTKDCSSDELVGAVRAVAGGETVLSPGLAGAMLQEVQKLGRAAQPAADPLITKREEEVLQLIADGLSTQEVAESLYISLKTVKNHLASIYQKLDSRDRTQAVVRAVRMGIIQIHPEDGSGE
jgi:DNA-binding NarL/FixJ family response regulator